MIDVMEKNIQEIMSSSSIKTFGFILYSDENPNMVKLLRDDDYWNALNSASGEKFFIFSVKPKKGSFGFSDMPPGTLGVMAPTWKEPNDNKELLQVFEINSTQSLPLFLIFTKVGSHLLKHSIKIDETNTDAALLQLRKIFYKIDEVANSINSEFEHEAQVHDKFSEILQKHNFLKIVSNIYDIFGVVKKISGVVK